MSCEIAPTMASTTIAIMTSLPGIIIIGNGNYVQIGDDKKPKDMDYDICVYHGPCSDGLAASWAVQMNDKSIRMIAQAPGCHKLFNYMGKDKWVGKTVVFVDICPVLEVLNELVEVCKHVTILDHHETNRNIIMKLANNAQLPPNLDVIFDMERAGCQIAWDYFHYDNANKKVKPRPWFLDYIGDGDLWFPSERKTPNPLPDSRSVTKGLHVCGYLDSRSTLYELYKKTYNVDDHYQLSSKLTLIQDILIPTGKQTIKTDKKVITNMINRAWLVEYISEDGPSYYGWLVNNTNYTITSDLGHQMLNRPIVLSTMASNVSDANDNKTASKICNYPGAGIDKLHIGQALTYCMKTDTDMGETIEQLMPAFSVIIRGYDPLSRSMMISLRGGESHSPNVADIASRFGGGGHAAAAGMEMSTLDFHTYFKVIEHAKLSN